MVPLPITTRAIDRTCELYSNFQLEYTTLAEVTHVPVLYASQRICGLRIALRGLQRHKDVAQIIIRARDHITTTVLPKGSELVYRVCNDVVPNCIRSIVWNTASQLVRIR